jgi:septum formation protein
MTTSPFDLTADKAVPLTVLKKTKFVLASGSPRRRELLAQINVKPDLIDPADIDETPFDGEHPKAYALRVSLEKGNAVAIRHPGALVLSADTVVACGKRILPKAESLETALECLKILSGRRHRVITGMALTLADGKTLQKSVETVVTFKKLSVKNIDQYLASNDWKGKAGGYAIQGQAASLIRFIAGSYSNVVGLPLFEVSGWLEAHFYNGSQHD